MKLYNTLSRKLEDFKPIEQAEVRMYSCGPTVYDYMHIGNLRKFVFDDTLRRSLQISGYRVKHVMNVTDVGHLVSDADEGEDKVEMGAKREGKTARQIADHYTQSFMQDITDMNILPPNAYQGTQDTFARATDFIDQQLAIVKALIDKGFAYKSEQAIYFDISRLPNYGQLTGQRLADKTVAARSEVVKDKNKRNPHDFALWFFTTGRFANHEMYWPSPWGEGFPGWHLECSAIIHATLGDPIDIHTGGVDNIGTHHVNEMAQSEAAFDHKLANYWVHSEHLLVDSQKMAKSKGNFRTLKDVKERGYSPMALRLLFLQAHYRSQMNFTWESLDGASTRLKKYQDFAARRFQSVAPNGDNFGAHMIGAPTELLLPELQKDLDTPGLLAKIDTYINKVQGQDLSNKAWRLDDYLHFIDEALGLGLMTLEDISSVQKELISDRESARKNGDWKHSDKLRAKLHGQGIEINDTQNGPIWSQASC